MKKSLIALLLCLVLCCGFAGSALAQTVVFGSTSYEPLCWDVLYADGQYTTLISKTCVACQPFGDSNNWHSSYLRYWLNNGYLYGAFTPDERCAMVPVEGDMIRLPSVGDMTNFRFGYSANRDAQDRTRSARANAVAVNQGVWTNDYGYCSYYTMTPCDSTSMYQVRTDGSIGVARIDRDNVGVRIMIKVKTNALY
ncbi:MAG: hypothetical protein IKU70_05460 [Clostridia bacterium]|nr:hypothetical protein [Clostridia bacterium]